MKRREFLAGAGVGAAGLVLPIPVLGAERKPYRVEIYLAHEVFGPKSTEVQKVAAIDKMTLPEGFGDNMVPYEASNSGVGRIDHIRFDTRKLSALVDTRKQILHHPEVWGEWVLVIDQWSEPSYHLHLEHMKVTNVKSLHVQDDFVVLEGARFQYNGYKWSYFTKDSSYIDQRAGVR
jgi:hypothetical protein